MNKDQIMEAIENMTVLELTELVHAIEDEVRRIRRCSGCGRRSAGCRCSG